MAATKLESLVLGGVRVGSDVLGQKRTDSNPVVVWAPASQSLQRPSSLRFEQAGYATGLPRFHAAFARMDNAVRRAGRPRSNWVLASRSPARTAQPAIRFGWSASAGADTRTASAPGIKARITGCPAAAAGRIPSLRVGAERQAFGRERAALRG